MAAEGVENNHCEGNGILDFDLNELDDTEFDIPPTDNIPTLESILKPSDDEEQSLDYFFPLTTTTQLKRRSDEEETESVSSQEGTKFKKEQNYERHDSIVRHIILKGVSRQMASAVNRIDSGTPTALAVGSSFIAIGTSHGLVLVFESSQALKWCFNSAAVGARFGAISSLSFNCDGSRLLCGFVGGQIMMYNMTNGKLLRTVTDAHMPNASTVHLKFTDDKKIALTSDSTGSVFQLTFRHLIGVRTCESQCLFSGNRGEICAMEPLRLPSSLATQIVDRGLVVFAMASQSKVLIVALQPQLKVCYTHRFVSTSPSLPVLSWQCIFVRASNSISPALAFSKDQTITIVQVSCQSSDDIQVTAFDTICLSYSVMSLSWIYPHTIVIINHENAHVVDIQSKEELELIDLSDVQLVNDASFYKFSQETTTSSDQISRRPSYQSSAMSNGQLVLLGERGIHVLTLRSWSDRIDLLVRNGSYELALDLAQSFHDGLARAVLGLPGNRERRKETVSEKIFIILNSFVDLMMTKLCPSQGKIEELEEHYQSSASVCIEHCLLIGRLDFLYGRIYERFAEDALAKGAFLECLEPYILKDSLTTVTSTVLKSFIDYYELKGMMSSIEACIVHLDIASIDANELISRCWSHGLYDAFIYIFNHGMRDYVKPLEKLLQRLSDAIQDKKKPTYDEIQLGNKTLVYISCCLAGRSYPLGDIPHDLITLVRDGVLECLTVKGRSDDRQNFQNLRTLINFDCHEFFNVLSLSFEMEEFELEKKQSFVDLIVNLMVEEIGFSSTQFGVLFTFLARQMARNEQSISINQIIFDQILESLCASSDDSRHEERQQALIELVSTKRLNDFDSSRLVELATNARFFRVCEILHETNRDFDLIVECYWKDISRQNDVFDYVRRILSDVRLSNEERTRVRNVTLDALDRLVKIDSKESARLALDGCIGRLSDAVRKLISNDDDSFYDFLQKIFELQETEEDVRINEMELEPKIYEKYIELICRKSTQQKVLHFLRSIDTYRLEETLDICRRYDQNDAVAYLLEKSGDIKGAFELFVQRLRKSLNDAVQKMKTNEVKFNEIEALTTTIVELLERNSIRLNQTQKEFLWFSFLEILMSSKEEMKKERCLDLEMMKSSDGVKNGLKRDARIDVENDTIVSWMNVMTHHMIDVMMSYIPLQIILQKILENPTNISGTFGEMKDLLFGMLDSCNYERTLIETCAVLVNKDIHRELSSLTSTSKRAVIPNSDVCSLCSWTVWKSVEKEVSVFFQCGHCYHYTCLVEIGASAGHAENGERKWKCFLCDRRHRPTVGGRRMNSKSVKDSKLGTTSTSMKSRKKETILDSSQILAIEDLRSCQKSSSNVFNLFNRKRHENKTILNDRFPLRIAAPPPPP